MAANLTRFVFKNRLDILSGHNRSNLKTTYWSKEPLLSLFLAYLTLSAEKPLLSSHLDTGFTLLFSGKREHVVGEKTEFENESTNP